MGKALCTYHEGRLTWIFLSDLAADIISLYVKDCNCLSWFQEVGCKQINERENWGFSHVLWEAIYLRKHLLHHGNMFCFNDETQAIKQTYHMFSIYIGFSCFQRISLSRSYIKESLCRILVSHFIFFSIFFKELTEIVTS